MSKSKSDHGTSSQQVVDDSESLSSIKHRKRSAAEASQGSSNDTTNDMNPPATSPDTSPSTSYSTPHRPAIDPIAKRNSNAQTYDIVQRVKDFWPSQNLRFEVVSDPEMREHCKHMELPMARVKKIMKIDDNVKSQMISQDGPTFLAAVSEMFVEELTLKAWQIVEEGRRKTLQKSDVASAVGRYEHFDFLIDIVPRDEAYRGKHANEVGFTTVIGADGQPMQAQLQYVMGDGDNSAPVFQLDNGQVLENHVLKSPQLCFLGTNKKAEGSVQIPPGMQVVHVPTTSASTSTAPSVSAPSTNVSTSKPQSSCD